MDYAELLAMRRAVLESALREINKQSVRLNEEAIRTFQATVQLLSSGNTWNGAGSDKFLEELSQHVIPQLLRISSEINAFHRNIEDIRDMLDRTDEVVERTVKTELQDSLNFFSK